MDWSLDATKWKCLAPGNLSYKSLRRLARYWFCGEHQVDNDSFESTVSSLWAKCTTYWRSIGRHPRRQRNSNDGRAKLSRDDETNSSRASSSPDTSLLSDSSDPFDCIIDGFELTSQPLRALRENTAQEIGEQSESHLPWNDQSIFEEDQEDDDLERSHPWQISGTRSHSVEASADEPPGIPSPSFQHPSNHLPEDQTCGLRQDNFGEEQASRVPGTFPDEVVGLSEELAHDIIADPAAPTISRTKSTTPVFEHCGIVSNEDVFNKTFIRLRTELLQEDDGPKEAYVYVMQSASSRGYVKIGTTKRSNHERRIQIDRCAGKIVPVKIVYNICTVRNFVWLEKTIHQSLESRARFFKCPSRCKRRDGVTPTKHGEWFEEDAEKIAFLVEQWRQWMRDDPYDGDGRLFPKWERRISFFESLPRKVQYLVNEPDLFKAWSIFFDPPWWIRLHMALYDEFLRQRGKVQCRRTLLREQIREHPGQLFRSAMAWSAVVITVLLYTGCCWISNPMTLPLIVVGVSFIMVWRT
ncbi:MAG: hypothetical protein Q9168_006599 [Polycauliona sp. 1 TL-2023]